jgi:hypothetical protein
MAREVTQIHMDTPGAHAQKYGINPMANVKQTVSMNTLLKQEMGGMKTGFEGNFIAIDPTRELASADGATVRNGKRIGDLLQVEEPARPAGYPPLDTVGHPHNGCTQAGLLKEIPGRPGVYRCTGCGQQMIPRKKG